MKPLTLIVSFSSLSWLMGLLFLDRQTSLEVLYGMLGPLAAVSGTWILAERVYLRNPEGLTAVMVAGFAAKLVFFGAYVAIMLRVLSLRPIPFVISFTGYFIALYLIEALYLRRLFGGGMRASR